LPVNFWIKVILQRWERVAFAPTVRPAGIPTAISAVDEDVHGGRRFLFFRYVVSCWKGSTATVILV
jgi:hypothetical protein